MPVALDHGDIPAPSFPLIDPIEGHRLVREIKESLIGATCTAMLRGLA